MLLGMLVSGVLDVVLCCVVLCCMLVLGVLGVGKRDGGCP